MKNAINWFEIPVTDIARAKKFYETIFGFQTMNMSMGDMKMETFPADQQGVSGALIQWEHGKPSAEGTMVYLNADGILDEVLSRVEKAGGKVAMPKTLITEEYGHMGVIIDTEGNRVGLHSPNRG
jgi:predicted enzyme related to lactoylglutathione lyase